MSLYDKEDIFNKAQEVVKNNNLFFVSDIIAYLPCSGSTFYEYFPAGSDELESLKELLESNRVSTKVKMRKNWFESENATLQMGLYKLVASDDERKYLSQSHVDHTTKGDSINLTPEERAAKIEALKSKLNADR